MSFWQHAGINWANTYVKGFEVITHLESMVENMQIYL